MNKCTLEQVSLVGVLANVMWAAFERSRDLMVDFSYCYGKIAEFCLSVLISLHTDFKCKPDVLWCLFANVNLCAVFLILSKT